jgi:serine protease Do
LVVSSLEEISPEDREKFNLNSGVMVKEVFSGPAKEAGIQPGDVITSISQRKIKNLKDYTKIVKSLKKGSSVPIRIVRQGNGSFLTIKILK